ncbi:DNA polymerase III subunit alpha [Oceanirhabdus sp. W0125-5]|uniref:DNA polymerase III subunit alpha n=1 Tax=Oceanirhabdus sp. W0125-5 TaxID=2999116 RepID=UPI0022F2F2E1|nr:DNA polymerase III subunit alpha [Oceanirhabdus sp. W0125-5]WBW99736.1 DNA polymerase III subunit alpha [Oceanirhabdus sp. W0125-5]
MINSVREFKREDLGKFAHLHVHTGYSLLDGSGKIKDIISRAKELGMGSIAITDHGNMFGCVEFYKEALKQGVKPIIGCEVYVVPKSMHIKRSDSENETHHLILLVKNEIGYKNLMKIVTTASVEGFYYKPRIDRNFLKEHSEGLIAASACLGGEIPKQIMYGNLEKAREIAKDYKAVFKDDYYIELQNHGMKEEIEVNTELINIAQELQIPLICSNDVHYIKREDSVAHDTLLCIQTGKTVDDENRMRFPNDEFYLKSPEEMKNLFSDVPEAIENTIKIAEKCNFDYEFHVSKLPKYPIPEGETADGYLKKLCYEGLKERYADINTELTERLEYELGIINQMGYDDYFLIVWDFIKYANDTGIMTGPGRGSAAGSLVAYTLGITKIDPIKYNLIFERFLNPERISMPDIDSDFCYERRQEVIDYVVDKYGEKNVSQIVTFGTMAARACIRDVGRALNYSYNEVDRIAKMIPSVLNITIDKALEMNFELSELYNSDSRVKELIDISKTLEGLPRHTSTHAAGVVIASKELVNYVPLLKTDESIVAQFDMNTLEELGLLKMDFLGLRNLTVIRDAVDIIHDNYNVKIDIDSIDYGDKNVYKMLGEGKTAGVFQLESSGMTSFMKDLKPDSLEDIIAGISLYRPGPMASIPKYLKYKKNTDLIEYETPELESILDVTYGCMVYQEQVMQIVRDLAGYSMGRSDLVRRAMSKKKHKVMEEERKNFVYGAKDENGEVIVPGCIAKGISKDAANSIYDAMMDFASYAFNKSHAAAYAIVAYQTAYLMCYYPTEFIAAMLNSVMGSSEKVAFYIRFAEKRGIQLLAPDINESEYKFTSKDKKIRFGLGALKNVGENAIMDIVYSRKDKGNFKDFMDFCNKVRFNHLNKRAVESLIKGGAFDTLECKRSQLMAVYERVIDGIQNDKKRNIEGQISLFEISSTKVQTEAFNSLKLPDIQEFRKKHLLAMEKEVTGLYISGHPLEEYEGSINNMTSKRISDIVAEHEIMDEDTNEIMIRYDVNENERVIIGGIISEVSKKVTKRNDLMAFIKIQDVYDEIEGIIFPKTLREYEEKIYEDNIVIIKGRINIREEEKPKLICENIRVIEKSSDENIYIQVFNKADMKHALNNIELSLDGYKGETPVKIYVKGDKAYLTDNKYWVDGSIESLSKLREIFGSENVKVVSNHAS